MPKKYKLPNELIVIPNPDKSWHAKWTPKTGMLNLPHPFRGVLMGPPNSGKTLIIKNILLHADPPFEEVFVVHCDAEFTKEYDDVEATMLSEIPAPEEWEGLVKTLVIIDDIELTQMKKDQKRNLDRLFGFVSTHKNISVLLTSQEVFSIPPIVRRCSNLWVLWRMNDLDSMSRTARKCGLSADALKSIFDNVMDKKTDSLWVDMTDKSPYPLRKNGFTIINKKKSM